MLIHTLKHCLNTLFLTNDQRSEQLDLVSCCVAVKLRWHDFGRARNLFCEPGQGQHRDRESCKAQQSNHQSSLEGTQKASVCGSPNLGGHGTHHLVALVNLRTCTKFTAQHSTAFQLSFAQALPQTAFPSNIPTFVSNPLVYLI